ncbi:hypothetical protein [uncultured Paracoccus sp.]|uniref:hypothetical protein n=1 Tax=uncultured Paracoccus sp. TaxID=189685 RepID=UPI0026037064|nr:hypothetical protein [uncultured Paracoccus sp.]
MIAPFGHPGSVTPAAIDALPAAMQREGILLLMEMGLTLATVAKAMGRPPRAVSDLIRLAPIFRHESQMADARGEA